MHSLPQPLQKTARLLLKHGSPEQVLRAVAQAFMEESERIEQKRTWSVLKNNTPELNRLRRESERIVRLAQRVDTIQREPAVT